MSAVESTARTSGLKLLKGYVFCPMTWNQVMAKDTILSPLDGETRYVVYVEKHYATAIVTVMHGDTRVSGEKNLADPVHVLEDATGDRYADYLGARAVRQKRGQS